jgi:hypothetical protein
MYSVNHRDVRKIPSTASAAANRGVYKDRIDGDHSRGAIGRTVFL